MTDLLLFYFEQSFVEVFLDEITNLSKLLARLQKKKKKNSQILVRQAQTWDMHVQGVEAPHLSLHLFWDRCLKISLSHVLIILTIIVN